MAYKFQASTGLFFNPVIHKEIPQDVVDISNEHFAFLQNRKPNQIVVAGDDGMPALQEVAPIAGSALIKMQIAELESQVTQRRLREALLGTDSGWLAGIDAQIAALRELL